MYITYFLFCLSVGVIIYVFIGYPILIAILAKFRTKLVGKGLIQPSVTLLISAYNEKYVIRKKIENSLKLEYPNEKLEIVIVADGSTDCTCSIVSEYANQGIVLHYEPKRRGKTSAINRVITMTHGDIILFSDANNIYRPDVIQNLVNNFADPIVGAVTGKKILYKTKSALSKSENLYWRYESFIRKMESQFGSTAGALGEVLAIRRELYSSIPDSVINDDFFIAMQVIKQGYRVIYEPEAVSEEMPSASLKAESVRRTRISAGNYQAFVMLPTLFLNSPIFVFQAISHKLLRPLVPIFMILALITNLIIVLRYGYLSNVFIIALIIQTLFYFLAAVGAYLSNSGIQSIPFYIPYYFCFTNFSYLKGLFSYIFGRQSVIWDKAERESNVKNN